MINLRHVQAIFSPTAIKWWSALYVLIILFYGSYVIWQVAYPESTERRLWGQSLKKPEGAPLNLG